MDKANEQYEVFPYPARDPSDEAKRLITGSPSWPQEMDHWLWGGMRDWTEPLRILVAGGGTGDAMIQLAQVLTSAGRPYKMTYMDLSKASREIAEQRAKIRGLKNINFVTESLLDAAKFGKFNYIDCCGVLHHLPQPQDGFDALSAALTEDGGIGLMVYAPHGRAGVYPLQDAFRKISKRLAPQDRLALAKQVYTSIPDDHPFKRNPHLIDHTVSDAGFYDLLLHSTDQAFRISDLCGALDRAGLAFCGAPEPVYYDPAEIAPDAALDGLTEIEKMQVCEDLRGTIAKHIVYAKRADAVQKTPMGNVEAIPHVRGVDPKALAKAIAQKGEITITLGGNKKRLDVPKAAAVPVAGVNGRRSLQVLQAGSKMDPIAFNAAWQPFERIMTAYGMMHYSNIYKGL